MSAFSFPGVTVVVVVVEFVVTAVLGWVASVGARVSSGTWAVFGAAISFGLPSTRINPKTTMIKAPKIKMFFIPIYYPIYAGFG